MLLAPWLLAAGKREMPAAMGVQLGVQPKVAEPQAEAPHDPGALQAVAPPAAPHEPVDALVEVTEEEVAAAAAEGMWEGTSGERRLPRCEWDSASSWESDFSYSVSCGERESRSPGLGVSQLQGARWQGARWQGGGR